MLECFFCYVEESKALLVLFNLQAPAAADILVSVQTIWDWLQIITLGFLLAVTRHMDTMTKIAKRPKNNPSTITSNISLSFLVILLLYFRPK